MKSSFKTIPLIVAALMTIGCSSTADAGQNTRNEKPMKIRIIAGDKQAIATLDDTPTARDFVSLLPFTLTLEDYNGTEKISQLPKKLTKDGAPAAVTPKAGDIAFYAPWGNLAIFYRDFGNSPGLIRLGRIERGMDALASDKPFKVKIEAITKEGN